MKKSLAFALVLAAMVACDKAAPAPEGTIESKESVVVPFDGATIKYSLTANCDWKVTTTTVDVVPMKGTEGTTELTVVVPPNHTSDAVKESFTVAFTNADGVSELKVVEIAVPAPSLEYGGYTYGVKYFGDGNYWMTENLHYIPEGVNVSDDPKTGTMWYPYNLELKEGAKSPTVKDILKDDASIAKFGYFYSPALALGVEKIDASNYNALEKTRGICPEGWHIPSAVELFKLCGASVKMDNEAAKPADDPNAMFWDPDLKYGSVAKSFEQGFNFQPAGSVMSGKYMTAMIDDTKCDVKEYLGMNGMTYLLGSTGHAKMKDGKQTGEQMTGMMTTFTKVYMKGRLSVAYLALNTGVSVRCVKDK